MQAVVLTSGSPPPQQTFTSSFKEEWCGCFDDTESCLISCFCPCIQYGKNYVVTTNPQFGANPDGVVSAQTGTCMCMCLVYSVGLYFCGPIASCVLGGLNRTNLRRKYGISTGDCADDCSDLCIHCCCTCCALSQEWRELKHRANQPMTIAVPGGVIVGTQVQSPGVIVQQPGMVMSQPQYAQPQQGYAQPQQGYPQQQQPVAYGQPQGYPQQQQPGAVYYAQPQQGQPMQQGQAYYAQPQQGYPVQGQVVPMQQGQYYASPQQQQMQR